MFKYTYKKHLIYAYTCIHKTQLVLNIRSRQWHPIIFRLAGEMNILITTLQRYSNRKCSYDFLVENTRMGANLECNFFFEMGKKRRACT